MSRQGGRSGRKPGTVSGQVDEKGPSGQGRPGGGRCRVSVCLAACNGEAYIRDQVASILGQLTRDDELIVSDDRSADQTRRKVREFRDPRIRLVTHPGPPGVVANVETALHHARGDYIFLSDQDDVWRPHKVAVLLDYLTRCDLVVSDCCLVSADMDLIHPSYMALRQSGTGLWKNLRANSYMGACMAFHRRVLDHALPFPSRVPMHDWWLGLVGEMVGQTSLCNAPLMFYRRHGGNLSPEVVNDRYSLAAKLRMRLDLVTALAQRWADIHGRKNKAV